MRKLFTCLTLVLFAMTTAVSAQTAMPQSAVPAAGINSRVGVAAGVKGSVQLARDGGVGQVVSSGAEIFLGDKISTDAKGGLQILLLDQTTFTIGANSSIVVDQFIYDPATDAGKVSVRVVEGTFRFITGKIAKKNPENMQVDLPNGTIGVRGTMVMGKVDGTKSLAILTGPGDKNNTGSRNGAMIVGGKGGDNSKSVRIAKTGFGTEIAGNGAPKIPFLVPQAMLDALTSELSPKSGDDDSGGDKSDSSGDGSSDSSGDGQGDSEGSASEQAGQDAVDAGGALDAAGSLGDLSSGFGDEASKTAQEIASDTNTIIDSSTTTIAQMAALVSGGGMAIYDFTGGVLRESEGVLQGTFNVHLHINFGGRYIGDNINDSKIDGVTSSGPFGSSVAPYSFLFYLGEKAFSTDPAALASFQYPAISDSNACGATCKANVTVNLVNTTAVAGAANVSVVLTDSGDTTATLNGAVVAPRP